MGGKGFLVRLAVLSDWPGPAELGWAGLDWIVLGWIAELAGHYYYCSAPLFPFLLFNLLLLLL